MPSRNIIFGKPYAVFIISPIFLLLLYHCWKIALITIAGTMLASFALIGTLAGIEDFNANLYLQGAKSSWNIIYEKPHCRINSYLIGIVLGFALYKKWRVRSKLVDTHMLLQRNVDNDCNLLPHYYIWTIQDLAWSPIYQS